MNSNDDLVSVVIPVFNSETFLEESIKSIINQTHKNQEIIAIDDGSTDNSLKILQLYADKITIYSQENQGLASALSVGIKMMKGKWFKWFSPDDILFPNAIQILVEEAKRLPENTIVYSNWDIIDEKGKKLRSFSESNYNDLDNFEYNIRLLDGQIINVNTTLIPSSLFDNNCVFQNLEDPVLIDYDFFLRAGILHFTKFHLISKPLLKYRIHSEQLSHTNISNSISNLSQVKNEILLQIDPKKRDDYISALENYKKKKNLAKKTMEFGLKLATFTLPDKITDSLLAFYLNKIRRIR